MRWCSTIATLTHLEDAIAEAAETLSKDLEPAEVSLVLAFVSSHHEAHIEELPALLRQAFPAATLFGCVASGTIGSGREVEGDRAVVLMAGCWLEVGARVLHFGRDPDSWTQPSHWGDDTNSLVVLADPATCDSTQLIARLEHWYGDSSTIVGGLTSGSPPSGSAALLCNDRVVRSGALVLELSGNLEIDTIVAQGCRPIGEPMFVTESQGSVISQIDGMPALEAIQRLQRKSSSEDRDLLRRGIQIGVAMERQLEVYEAGDFLIRDLLGVDTESKAISIGYEAKPTQVIQFHVRDAETADEELRELLARHQYARPAGVLLFSCVGRGRRFFGTADHDCEVFTEQFGDVPIAGFFGHGEIGPLRGKTFVHGYTSAFALLRAAREPHS